MTQLLPTVLKPKLGRPNIFSVLVIIVTLVSLTACGTPPSAIIGREEPASASKPTGIITLGRVSDDPTDKIREWGPLVDYLADNLHEFGIGIGEVKVSRDTQTMSRWMAKGEVDLFIDSFYSTMVVKDQAGLTPILFRQKGKADKHAVFFARAESGLKSLDDLRGETIALDDPESTTGFMLPVAFLLEQGFYPFEKTDEVAKLGSEEVGYIFAEEDERALRWVADGLIAAAAVDNESFEEFSEANPGVLSIIVVTEAVFREQMLMASPHIDEPTRAAIKSVLLSMGNTAEGQTILEELDSSKFRESLGEREEGLTRAEAMYQLVSNHLQTMDSDD